MIWEPRKVADVWGGEQRNERVLPLAVKQKKWRLRRRAARGKVCLFSYQTGRSCSPLSTPHPPIYRLYRLKREIAVLQKQTSPQKGDVRT